MRIARWANAFERVLDASLRMKPQAGTGESRTCLERVGVLDHERRERHRSLGT